RFVQDQTGRSLLLRIGRLRSRQQSGRNGLVLERRDHQRKAEDGWTAVAGKHFGDDCDWLERPARGSSCTSPLRGAKLVPGWEDASIQPRWTDGSDARPW